MKNEVRICPVCGKSFTEEPALSRKDDKTAICPDCGMKEALEAYMSATKAVPDKTFYIDKIGSNIENDSDDVKYDSWGEAMTALKAQFLDRYSDVFDEDFSFTGEKDFYEDETGSFFSVKDGEAAVAQAEKYDFWKIRKCDIPYNSIPDIIEELERAMVGLTQYSYELQDTFCCSRFIESAIEKLKTLSGTS